MPYGRLPPRDSVPGQSPRERGRPIRLSPMPDGGDSPCGVWLSTTDADWVFHQVTTSRLHQEHIILHELAHMIFDHKTVRDRAEEPQAQLLPDLDPRVIATVLGRMPYSSEREQEAQIAGLIGGHASVQPGWPARATLARSTCSGQTRDRCNCHRGHLVVDRRRGPADHTHARHEAAVPVGCTRCRAHSLSRSRFSFATISAAWS